MLELGRGILPKCWGGAPGPRDHRMLEALQAPGAPILC